MHSTGKTERLLRAYFDHEHRKGAEVIARFAKVADGWQGGRTLDFGCGAGGLTYRIAETCREAVGIDIVQYKLDFAHAQAAHLGTRNVEFVHYDGSFDCVVCVDVVEHLPTPEYFGAEFRRVLAPGGQLLLSFGPPWGHPHGKHMWAKIQAGGRTRSSPAAP